MASKKHLSYLKRHRIGFLILAAILVCVPFLLYEQEEALKQKRAELELVESRQAELEAAIELLEREKKYKNNEEIMESLARKKLNMIKQNEIIYIIKFGTKGE